jgi:type IV pilus assembly protein PilA
VAPAAQVAPAAAVEQAGRGAAVEQAGSEGPAGAIGQPGGTQPRKGLSCWIIGAIVLAASIPVLGVVSALAIHGVRRYIAAAKTSEAKFQVSAIGRAATGSYQAGRGICASSGPAALGHGPVPANVNAVRGLKYVPSTATGVDFQTGSADGGWRCLSFSVSQPMHYQLHYNAGGNYQVPAASAEPVNGFEAAAIGDLDADGTVAKFGLAGRVVGGLPVIKPSLAIENEFE